jgi:hypothetical protein
MVNPMNLTELTTRRMLAAIEAPLYDVGVLSDRGMLPGIDGIPADVVLAKLSLLKYRNARGSHIYIRPSGHHRYTVLDDLNATSLARLSAGGFDPCAVVETSVDNFQVWLKHAVVLPKLIGILAAQLLARRYEADLSAAGWRRFGRLPGFTNCKPKYGKPDGLFPFVRLISHTGVQYPMAFAFHEEVPRCTKLRNKSERCVGSRLLFLPKGEGGSTLQTTDAPNLVVLLTPTTQVDQVDGILKARKKQMAMTCLIPGLPVQVQGSMNAQGQLVAASVKFKGNDLQAAMNAQAGLQQTVAAIRRLFRQFSGR